VDWKLLGRPPPKNESEWQQELDKYKSSPEYQLKNRDITLSQFKFIWHMEYGHRMWGRLIGACFYLPAGYFWAKGHLPKAMKPKVLAMGALILGQGLLGE